MAVTRCKSCGSPSKRTRVARRSQRTETGATPEDLAALQKLRGQQRKRGFARKRKRGKGGRFTKGE